MKTQALTLAALLAAQPLSAHANNNEALEQLRAEMRRLEQQHQAQLRRMEERINALQTEQARREPLETRAERPPAAGQPGSALQRFNPQLSVILDGRYYDDSADGHGAAAIGEAAGFHTGHGNHGHAHGHDLAPGFSLGETEIAFSASVDPYFDASLYLGISEDGDVAVEEAWAATRNLPAGLTLKGGKFLSGIGYNNSQHHHSWDFVDQNLAYRGLLGDHGLADTGLQLSWVPDWPWYTRFGVEALQGDHESFGALEGHDEKSGPRLGTAFVKFSPNLGYEHALQIGLFAAYSRQHQEAHEHGGHHELLDGDAWLAGTDWVYRYDAPHAYGQGDFKLQAEYLYRDKDLRIVEADDPAELGERHRARQDAFYLQGTYGIAPRWQLGARYSALGLRNEVGDEDLNDSRRASLALSFRPSEFSVLRLQLSRAKIATEHGDERFNQVFLQYQHSLGSHGAHSF
ncbi:TonB-dependent receptor [Alkalilimnicola sp. S0819]|uniref:TonB-dependent receptor n=1 Tax=Alkalilimnicola sp. S0819 TaxID=2613922 RepID=UPI0012615035|nr:TonB-dependent receptor [Alkalilimnicola sp. S0819]KAB7627221.1 porin [Alkalilimnicola sp. S0819]MPQ15934.1 porin [Alkalilimnicola sp. S0819]